MNTGTQIRILNGLSTSILELWCMIISATSREQDARVSNPHHTIHPNILGICNCFENPFPPYILTYNMVHAWPSDICKSWIYSRVHKRWQSFFSKILEKPSIVQKKMLPRIKGLDFSQRWSKKNFKMADLKNSKWPPQKNLIFQLRQFSIFFHEIFMDWSLG